MFDRGAFPFLTQGTSSPNVVYGLSDNTYQITNWLHHDAAAAAFLDGEPDKYGMKVNAAYLPSVSPAYPIDSFNANDVGHTKTVDNCGFLEPGGEYSCAVGGLQNNWFPINGLDNVARHDGAREEHGEAVPPGLRRQLPAAARRVHELRGSAGPAARIAKHLRDRCRR